MDMQANNGTPVRRDRRAISPQLVMGLLIVLVGVLFTLDNLGIAEVRHYVARYWPAGLIVVGLVQLSQCRRGACSPFGGTMFVLFGVLLLLNTLGRYRFEWRDIWPLALVLLGASMVWRGVQRQRPPSADSLSTISGTAVLAGLKQGNSSTAFRGGDLTAIMGGCEVDLRQAAIGGEAVLDVFALWGGIELRVPDDWTVISQVTPLLGGVEDKTRPPAGEAKHRLVLRGTAIMGGIEVKN